MKFLLVEDNQELAKAIASRMVLDGHVVEHAPDLADATEFIATGEFDLILLDIMLPDGDGRRFLEGLRTRDLDTPVIVLTARSQVSDRIDSLDLGADDYVTKPFDHAELEARCRAVLRRKAGKAQTVVALGGIIFDPVAGKMSVRGENVTLRNRELRLLELLINAPGQVFSKHKLSDRLFSYDAETSENAIEVYIGRLRKHLENSDLKITTLRGIGYRLDHEI
ncbi:response regulator transcription factor [Marinovum sp. 2_MG-2023]|uniref:response regulator transcription factor n=1 Tax=unclassified Marinovum TaxID=2647166 RepID=UPI0026E37CC7|nr:MULTISPECIES: response regulator transcription factor [unclassified Marinovum]MDO6729944.1 response regulator transcription factor [Marinovum sp. 2_MG-2023]MDO6779758.1 response regulator transcription factor [Marinovum sp. 1_MG-2023]